MEQEYFGVSLEKVIDQWGTDIIYGCVVTDHWNNHRNYFGTDPCTLP